MSNSQCSVTAFLFSMITYFTMPRYLHKKKLVAIIHAVFHNFSFQFERERVTQRKHYCEITCEITSFDMIIIIIENYFMCKIVVGSFSDLV